MTFFALYSSITLSRKVIPKTKRKCCLHRQRLLSVLVCRPPVSALPSGDLCNLREAHVPLQAGGHRGLPDSSVHRVRADRSWQLRHRLPDHLRLPPANPEHRLVQVSCRHSGWGWKDFFKTMSVFCSTWVSLGFFVSHVCVYTWGRWLPRALHSTLCVSALDTTLSVLLWPREPKSA